MKKTISMIIMFSLTLYLINLSTSAKPVFADKYEPKEVVLGGEAFGIRMYTKGVIVINVEEKLCGTSTISPAFEAGLKNNDIICSANNQKITSNETLIEIIETSQGKAIEINFIRNDKEMETTIFPKSDNNGEYKAGMWVKDSAAGIGTITYYDTETMTFGALGHGIYESETNTLMPLECGEIAKAKIIDIEKSKNGDVGSINGYFDDTIIGTPIQNCFAGVFGKLEYVKNNGEVILTASSKEIHTGNAYIYCAVEGEEPKAYDAKIKSVNKDSKDSNMIVEITDDNLLKMTGGIVQGMSGSPIIQDGKLIGALTHVLVNNVKCGYGIFIETMLENAS